MDQPELEAGALGLGSSRSHRFLSRLIWVYGGFTIFAAASLSLIFVPMWNGVRAQAMEAVVSGVGGLVVSVLTMTLMVLIAAFVMTGARLRYGAVGSVFVAEGENPPYAKLLALLRVGPGQAARQGQALAIGLGALLTCVASYVLWPKAVTAPVAMAEPNLIGAIIIAVAFVSLICERMIDAFPAPLLPEAPALRRVLLITTILLALAGALEIGRGVGLNSWVYWIVMALSVIPWIVAIELSLRAFARLFLPPPQPLEAHAIADSMFLAAVTGGARAPAVLIREHLGLDFARSWALSYLYSAVTPALLATALLCWGLSGLKLIDLDQRGIYERFGAPVAVLGPGIHLLPPWPIGVMRSLEYGAIHEVKVNSMRPDSALENIPAEAVPPAATNHLWDVADPAEAEYLVASQSGGGTQGFQVVSSEIHVLYRIGLTDKDAMEAVYGAENPAQLVAEAASRIVSVYFASHTLDLVMGAQRDTLAEFLRDSLARDLASYHAGVEIVSVHIESVHPPSGAAVAYHAVQAAEINANASIFNETGRAKRMAGVAQQEAHQLLASSQAGAEEKVQDAKGEAYQFNADRKAYAEGRNSFITERTYSNLVAALSQGRLTIVDHRLSASQAPIIDLRAPAATAPAPVTPPPVPTTPEGTPAPGAPSTGATLPTPPAVPPPPSAATSTGNAPDDAALTPELEGETP